MKLYTWFFIVLTLAQFIFCLTWFLFIRKLDRVILVSSIVYGGAMIIGYISYEAEKYRRRKKELLDDLP